MAKKPSNAVDKEHIIAEIKRTAKDNGGVALGWRRFEEETGIRYYDWYGQFWTKWSDATGEAGFKPNRMTEAYDEQILLEKLVMLTRSIGRVPTEGDMLIAARNIPAFPSAKVFRRFGSKHQRAAKIIEFCAMTPGNDDIATLWKGVAAAKESEDDETDSALSTVGYVYLLKHGSRREYKIGRTINPLRREGEVGIQLPETLKPVHYIKTDDPSGVENYWHIRFADKRKQGEWFVLTAADVSAFKRWRRIY